MNDRHLLANRPPLIFAGSPIDRGDDRARSPEQLEQAFNDPAARCLLLCDGDPALTQDRLWHCPVSDTQGWQATGPLIYLGRDRRGPIFGGEVEPGFAVPDGAELVNARAAAMQMPPDEAALFAHAKSLFAWRARHRFCSNCGAHTRQAMGGARRVCDSCDAEHFPRVDPVVIMLATDGDRCLLGRQASWPDGVWSALAGFVEPAETLEEACARELEEEAGIVADVAATRYIMCQPWPFPSSLMVGLVAPALKTDISIDTNELEQARWFSRKEVADMLAGRHEDAVMPPSIAIARRLAELWVDGQI